jgi:type VI secretion system protein ImpK
LSLFGSQLAGYRFFEILEQIRSKGKERLASLEVFHYCLLLGFQGKYRLESIESLNHLVARVGDEIDYLKGKKLLSHLLQPYQIKLNILSIMSFPFSGY